MCIQKRIFTVMLAVVLCLMGIPFVDSMGGEVNVCVSAETEADTPTISVGTVVVTLEELTASNYQVEVPITASETVMDLSFGMTLPNELTYGNKYESNAENFTIGQNGDFLWCVVKDSDGVDGSAVGGVFLNVADTAQVGDVYSITATIYNNNGQSGQLNQASGSAVTVVNGAVKIVDESGVTTPTITIGTVSVDIDDLAAANYQVEILIYASEDVTTLSVGMTLGEGLTYDEVYTDQSVLNFYGALNEDLVWAVLMAQEKLDHSEPIFYLVVHVDPDAEVGGVYSIDGCTGNSEVLTNSYAGEEICIESGAVEITGELVTPTISIGTVTMSLSELEAANYQVEVPITTNMDVTSLAFGMTLADGLTFWNCANDATDVLCLPISNGQYVWFEETTYTAIVGDSAATLTVQVTPNAVVGDVYDITGSIYTYSGEAKAQLNQYSGESVVVISGAIQIVEEDVPAYDAMLYIMAGGTSSWWIGDAGQISTTIQGDGSYSVGYTIQEGGDAISFLYLVLGTTIDVTEYSNSTVTDAYGIPEDCTAYIAIDSIEIFRTSGAIETLPYTGPSEGAFSTWNGGSTLCVNIYNVWGYDVTDVSSALSDGLSVGDTLVVNFTVSGLDGDSVTTTTSETTTTAATTTEEKNKNLQLCGDVNLDGVVTIADVVFLNKYVANLIDLNEIAMQCSDTNGDGAVGVVDVTVLLRFLVQLVDALPYTE